MENSDEPKTEKTDDPTIVETLIETLTQFYHPALTFADADETKSTQELIDEMEGIQDCIQPWSVNKLMESHNFKLHYNGSGYVWLLKMKECKN